MEPFVLVSLFMCLQSAVISPRNSSMDRSKRTLGVFTIYESTRERGLEEIYAVQRLSHSTYCSQRHCFIRHRIGSALVLFYGQSSENGWYNIGAMTIRSLQLFSMSDFPVSLASESAGLYNIIEDISFFYCTKP
jgi:hypothetical protein